MGAPRDPHSALTIRLIAEGLKVPAPNAPLVDPAIGAALVAAYRFITQPKRMANPRAKGPTVLTYETHAYNALTSQLRDAIERAGERL
jgi:hypothetical protein